MMDVPEDENSRKILVNVSYASRNSRQNI